MQSGQLRHRLGKGCLLSALMLLAAGAIAAGFLLLQVQRIPTGRPEYVALGSSFAAGAGLGTLSNNNPLLCARSVNGYPRQLARMRGLSLVDMSCGGAQARHLLRGGQFFQGPQMRAVGRETRLVTISVGGNDSRYIGDLSQLAARDSGSLWGRTVKLFWTGPRSTGDRNLEELQSTLIALLAAIRARAPDARIVIATYPTILPPAGTCPRLGLSIAEANLMRSTADQLAAATRSAARRGGAMIVDMHRLGANHHACSNEPWTYGWHNAGVAPFHPTLQGARATAAAISAALDGSPAAVPPIHQNDAAGHQAGGVGG